MPLRDDGRPLVVASATYAILDTRRGADDPAHMLAAGPAAVDSVSTTIVAAAGRSTTDPRVVTVASAVGIVAGRRYLLQHGGRAELVRVEGVSGTTLRLVSAVVGSFAGGAAFLGCELSCSVPADATGEDEYLTQHALVVRWEPDGLAPFLEQVFVERVAPAPLVSPDEVLQLDPTLTAYAGEDMTVADAVRQAADDFGVDMLNAGVEDDRILAGPIGRRAVLHLAAWHLIKHSTDPSAVSRAERYHARYAELRNGLLQGLDKAKTTRLTADATREPPDARSRFTPRW
ncbi:hypothetical protein [Nannocystis punicea]|uniref:Uncharacterized protein n=1 Tax=Nannocystis punicea TaxID=2995304 RepID=A0ABY7HDQ4_9BACT|nr:hypothetical protein [Nannocystis poenicansa]WAS97210.1 hypothetical protein O0S08_13765 [Nannocystis poenicansa]